MNYVRPSLSCPAAVSNVALGPLTGTPAMAVPMGFSKGTASLARRLNNVRGLILTDTLICFGMARVRV